MHLSHMALFDLMQRASECNENLLEPTSSSDLGTVQTVILHEGGHERIHEVATVGIPALMLRMRVRSCGRHPVWLSKSAPSTVKGCLETVQKKRPRLKRKNEAGESLLLRTRHREREREFLFERETEHLWLRQLMHGIGEGPR